MIDLLENELEHLLKYKDLLKARLLNCCIKDPGNNSVTRAKLFKEVNKVESRIKKIHKLLN